MELVGSHLCHACPAAMTRTYVVVVVVVVLPCSSKHL